MISSNYVPLAEDWRPPEWLKPVQPLQETPEMVPSRLTRFKVVCRRNLPVLAGLISALFLVRFKDDISTISLKQGLGTLAIWGLVNWWEYRQFRHLTCDQIVQELKRNPLVCQVLESPEVKSKLSIAFTERDQFFVNGKDIANSYARVETGLSGDSLEIKVLKNEDQIESFFSYLSKQLAGLPIKLIENRNRLLSHTIFEIMNVHNMPSFLQLTDKLRHGRISREDYTQLTEFVEMETLFKEEQAIAWGIKHLGWDVSMPKHTVNREISRIDYFKKHRWHDDNLSTDGKISHAEAYRLQWDKIGILYYYNHPEKIESAEFREYIQRVTADKVTLNIEDKKNGQKKAHYSVGAAMVCFYLDGEDLADTDRWCRMLSVGLQNGLQITWSELEVARTYLKELAARHPDAQTDPEKALLHSRLMLKIHRDLPPESLTAEERDQLAACQRFEQKYLEKHPS